MNERQGKDKGGEPAGRVSRRGVLKAGIAAAALTDYPPAGTIFDQFDAHGITWKAYTASLDASRARAHARPRTAAAAMVSRNLRDSSRGNAARGGRRCWSGRGSEYDPSGFNLAAASAAVAGI